MTEKGTLGPVEIVLPEWLDGEVQYQRHYKPVSPASRTVTGADDKIAPETDIATWSITDWSAGEGDRRWQDRKRYWKSEGVGPASDGSGLVPGMNYSVATGQSSVIARGGGRLVAARDMDDNLYSWSGSAWASLWAIGGTAGDDVISMAAVDNTAWFVLDDDGDIRKVTSGGNTLHYTGVSWTALVAYEGILYGMEELDLYSIDTSTATTRTLLSDTNVGEYVTETARARTMSTSDVGPIWISPTSDGKTLLKEYNASDDVAYTLGELPRDAIAYDILFYSGIYFVAFRFADTHASIGDAYLYYQIGKQPGVAGEFRADASTASDRITIAGVIGDRVFVTFQEKLWAYDLSDGGIVQVVDWSGTSLGDAYGSITFGKQVFLSGVANYGLVNTDQFLASTNQRLWTGMYDYGYLGMPKLIHSVTVSLEVDLRVGETVRVGYIVDGYGPELLPNDFSVAKASHTWAVSSSSQPVIGTEIEWVVRLLSSGSTSVSPVVVAINSDVSGARSRIEWTVAVDVGESSVNDGSDVISALNSLRTAYSVVSWSDPFQVDPYTADQTFDVRILDVSTPKLSDDGHLWAIVVFQSIAVYGPDFVEPQGG